MYHKQNKESVIKSYDYPKFITGCVIAILCIFITIYVMRKQILDRATETENMYYSNETKSYEWKSLEMKYIFEGK